MPISTKTLAGQVRRAVRDHQERALDDSSGGLTVTLPADPIEAAKVLEAIEALTAVCDAGPPLPTHQAGRKTLYVFQDDPASHDQLDAIADLSADLFNLTADPTRIDMATRSAGPEETMLIRESGAPFGDPDLAGYPPGDR